MPLRDHFRPPASKAASWQAVHGQWPGVIVAALNRRLPLRYVAHPSVHLGSSAEIDVSTYDKDHPAEPYANGDNGGVATAVWAPARPTLAVATQLPAQDEYEVRVYDVDRARRLVAAIEMVSPANKGRPENRRAFVNKCAALLQQQVSVTIIDLMTIRTDNLYGELLASISQHDPVLATTPTTYAVACRTTPVAATPGQWRLETWLHGLHLGQPLPTLPIWVADNFAGPLDLEENYEETCRTLRIA